MAAEVDIYNLALSRLGDAANVSAVNEISVQAQTAFRFYPIVRDSLLELHNWAFATRRVVGTLIDPSLYANGSWAYAYAEPASLLKILGVLPYGYSNDISDTQPFEHESIDDVTGVIVTNAQNATIRYTARVVNPARFSPLFVEAVSWALASALAGPLIKGDEGMSVGVKCWQAAMAMLGRATGSDANQSKKRLDPFPTWITNRGNVGSAFDVPATIIR